MTDRPTVAIIGAGFSGVLTALHLLTDPQGPRVRLIERAGAFGRGVAYSTSNPDHLLNVRVTNMSAFPGQPDHFVRWLASRSGWSSQGAFVTRGCYGDYLQDLLRSAVESPAEAGRLLLESDEAVDARPARRGWRVRLAMGREIDADAVVLALGVTPPAPPAGAMPALLASPRYLADPWGAPQALASDADHILLIGTGLTMVDVAIALARPGRRFTALSRHGLTPRAHAPVAARPPALAPHGAPAQVFRALRAKAEGGGWREAVDDLRPYIHDLWASWALGQRRQFLRHLRPWWDVHRHRLAPSVARRIEAMRKTGDLAVHAGRTQRLSPRGDQVEVQWSPRGGAKARRLTVDAVVNCTGPLGDLALSRDPLVRKLLAGGLIRPDACALGAEVDEAGRPLDAAGAPWPGLYAVGPLTRGAFWEITSVPDIRLQAAQTALVIGRDLGHRSAWGARDVA